MIKQKEKQFELGDIDSSLRTILVGVNSLNQDLINYKNIKVVKDYFNKEEELTNCSNKVWMFFKTKDEKESSRLKKKIKKKINRKVLSKKPSSFQI